jgi:hypothetical protein
VTEKAHAIEQILAVYMEAKLDHAYRELLQAKRWHDIEKNAYTSGKLLWAEHQIAAFKIVKRDIGSWRYVIKKYFKLLQARRKEKGLPPVPEVADVVTEFTLD